MNKKLAAKISADKLLEVFRVKKYVCSIGVGFLNPFGVRAAGGYTNTFNDIVGVIYRDESDLWKVELFEATTDPGKYYLENPMSAKGTGILAPNQYVDCYALGKHKNEYPALVQVKPVKVFRDNDKDLQYDLDVKMIEEGSFGANIHRANAKAKSTYIDKWSAACQVLADPKEYARLMELCDAHVVIYPNVFTYTLFEEEDLSLP